LVIGAQGGPKTPQDDPKTFKKPTKAPQDGPKTTKRIPKTPQSSKKNKKVTKTVPPFPMKTEGVDFLVGQGSWGRWGYRDDGQL